jgi:hypothetical protein
MLFLLSACNPGADVVSFSEDSAEDTADGGAADDVAPGPSCGGTWTGTPLNVLGDAVVHGRATDAQLTELDRLIDEALPAIPGPWTHRVAGPLRSADGHSFPAEAATVLDAASVADAVTGPDGRIWMFFVDADLEAMRAAARAGAPIGPGWRGMGGLGAAVSEDGASFTRVELNIAGALPLYVVDPDVVAMPDGTYHLYFLGIRAADACADSPDPLQVPGPHDVYRATSRDLTTWTLEGSVWTNEVGGVDPAVWCHDATTCHLLMGALAVSHDGGRHFATEPDAWPPTRTPDVVRLGDRWLLYRNSDDGVQMSDSEDGVRFVEQGVVMPSDAPTVVARDGEVWAWLSGAAEP